MSESDGEREWQEGKPREPKLREEGQRARESFTPSQGFGFPLQLPVLPRQGVRG